MRTHKKPHDINGLLFSGAWGGIGEEGVAVVRISGSIWVHTVIRPVFRGGGLLRVPSQKIHKGKN